MRTNRLACLLVFALAASACADHHVSVTVRVVTGLVAGAEFRTVQTTVLDAPMNAIASTEAIARIGTDYATGNNVASFSLSEQQYTVRVRLLRPNGTLLVERAVVANISADSVVSVHITRDCVGVVCPGAGGSALESTCLAGRCVDPRCSNAEPSYCPLIDFCASTSDCAATASCAAQLCDEGVCTPRAVSGECSDDEWCNPDPGAGCKPLEMLDEHADLSCGTICTMTSAPCRFGYVNCTTSAASFCEPLGMRPVGTSCASERVCDETGECVPDSTNAPGFVVTPTSGLITSEERGSATFTMALRTAPTADVVVMLRSSDFTEGGVTPASITFTPLDWNSAHTVTITGVNDGERDGTVAYSVVTSPATSSDTNYAGIDPDDVSVSNLDNDSPGLLLSRTSGLVTSEVGDADAFTVVLLAAPTASVSITFLSNAPDEATAEPSTVTFTTTNWASPQSVTVTGVDDAMRDGDTPFAIQTSGVVSADAAYMGMSLPDVLGVNVDDESPGIRVNAVAGLVTSEAGASATLTVALQSQPAADVTVPVASSDLSEGTLSLASITFTASDWDSPRTVRMTGIDDAVADGDQIFFANIGPTSSADSDYEGLSASDVQFTNTDNETPGINLSRTSGLVTSETGGTDTFSVTLRSQPTANVDLDVASTNSMEGNATPASLTFTSVNWNVPQSVTLTGVDDLVADGNRTYQINVHVAASADTSYAALSDRRVDATNTDNETAGISVSPTSGLVTSEAGGVATFTVVLTSQPTANVSMNLSSTASSEGVPSPTSLTFTSATWDTPQTVTVTGADDALIDGDIAYTIVTAPAVSSDTSYSGRNAADVSVTNTDNDVPPYTEQTNHLLAGPPPSGGYGNRIVLSTDGNTLAVAAIGDASSATGINGGHDLLADNSGAVYIYVRSGSTWTQQAYIKASNSQNNDSFGGAVALSSDGNTCAITAPNESSNATGINGNEANNSANGAGAVYVFVRAGSVWSQQAYVKASNTEVTDRFGYDIDVSSDGNTLAVGASNEQSGSPGVGANQLDNTADQAGAAYVFTRAGTTWSQQVYIKTSNTETGDQLGTNLVLSANGDVLAIAARGEDSNATGINGNQSDNSAPIAGAAYIFRRVAATWSQEAYVKASNTEAFDIFGWSLALSGDGDTFVVGVPSEDSNASTVNGNQADNSASGAGAAYVYRRVAGVWSQLAYLKPSLTGGGFGNSVECSYDGSLVIVGGGITTVAGALFAFVRTS